MPYVLRPSVLAFSIAAPVANEAKGEKSIPESKVKHMGEEWAKKTATKRADFFSEPHRPFLFLSPES